MAKPTKAERDAAFRKFAQQRDLRGYQRDVAETAWRAALEAFPEEEPLHFDPVIDGLFRILPAPGSEWSLEDRQKWLEIAEHSIKRAYAEKADPPFLNLSPREDTDDTGEPALQEIERRGQGE